MIPGRVSELSERAHREVESEAAAMNWIEGKETIIETGIAAAPLCGFRTLKNGDEDFLIRIEISSNCHLTETYTSGAKMEYEVRGDFRSDPLGIRSDALKTGKFAVYFPEGGIFSQDGSLRKYTSPFHTVSNVKASSGAGSRKVRIGKSTRLFARAERLEPAVLTRKTPTYPQIRLNEGDPDKLRFMNTLERGKYEPPARHTSKSKRITHL